MNGRNIAAVPWRHRWAALLTVVIVAALTALWLVVAPRAYTATAQLVAAPQPLLAQSPQAAAAEQATVAHLADSVPVLAAVRAQVGPQRTVTTLIDEVSASAIGGTDLIRINVEDAKPGYARAVANSIARTLPRFDPSSGQLRFRNAGLAVGPTPRTSPDVSLAVWSAVGAAIVLAIAIAFLRELAAGTVDQPRQIEVLADTRVLATIPRPRDTTTIPAESPGPDADRFRSLRVALEFATSDAPTSAVVIAPVVADAAAAWLVVNLATALAHVQRRVLIVDADLANPAQHPAFRSKGPGLAEVLRGEADVRDAVRPCTVPGVSVLPAGKVRRGTAAPADLVELYFHKTLSEVDQEVDLILVHAPAVTRSDDAAVMSVGSALMVLVTSGRVRARVLREAATTLRQRCLRLAGAVFLTR